MFFEGPLVSNGCMCAGEGQHKYCLNVALFRDELRKCERCSTNADCPGNGNTCGRDPTGSHCADCRNSSTNLALEACAKATCTNTPTPEPTPSTGVLSCLSHKDCTLVNGESNLILTVRFQAPHLKDAGVGRSTRH